MSSIPIRFTIHDLRGEALRRVTSVRPLLILRIQRILARHEPRAKKEVIFLKSRVSTRTKTQDLGFGIWDLGFTIHDSFRDSDPSLSVKREAPVT